MKYKNKQSIGLTLLASLFLSHAATAAVFTWDGFINTDWDTVSENWTVPGAFWPALAGDNDAAFAGDGVGAVAVHVDGISVNDLSFTAAGYNIAGPGKLTLSETTNIITTTTNATISAGLKGTNGFTKNGVQALTLTGDNSELTGTITLDNIAGTNNSGIVFTSAAAVGGGREETWRRGSQVGQVNDRLCHHQRADHRRRRLLSSFGDGPVHPPQRVGHPRMPG
jgi:hypothetical protein